jgi:hypothetical protein
MLYFLQNKIIYKNNVHTNIGLGAASYEKYEKLKYSNVTIQDLVLETEDKIKLKGWFM